MKCLSRPGSRFARGLRCTWCWPPRHKPRSTTSPSTAPTRSGSPAAPISSSPPASDPWPGGLAAARRPDARRDPGDDAVLHLGRRRRCHQGARPGRRRHQLLQRLRGADLRARRQRPRRQQPDLVRRHQQLCRPAGSAGRRLPLRRRTQLPERRRAWTFPRAAWASTSLSITPAARPGVLHRRRQDRRRRPSRRSSRRPVRHGSSSASPTASASAARREPTTTTMAATGSGSASTRCPAIPEPETYALMLAGLALLRVVARRRRS